MCTLPMSQEHSLIYFLIGCDEKLSYTGFLHPGYWVGSRDYIKSSDVQAMQCTYTYKHIHTKNIKCSLEGIAPLNPRTLYLISVSNYLGFKHFASHRWLTQILPILRLHSINLLSTMRKLGVRDVPQGDLSKPWAKSELWNFIESSVQWCQVSSVAFSP